ncbi:TolC family protein [Rickettsiales bacterium]|nr:TolC family protein [Rickettsiales bacterium]MDB2550234.1 TolC family protein [Rickettsiales bacterium]
MANDIFFLNPQTIKKEIFKDPARIKEIENYLINSKINENTILENFQPKITGAYSYEETNQEFENFFPVISPSTSFETAIEKTFQSGIEASIGNISTRRKFGTARPETRNALFFNTNIDLYKNFLGKTSKSQVKNVKLQKQIANLQKQIDSRIFEFAVLKIYYDLILNSESIRISEKLLKLSQKQLKDLQKKYNNKIANIDDVERQRIEVISRDSKILSLKKEKEIYLKRLRQLLPNLSDKNIKLSKYNYNQIERKFLSLTDMISSKNKAPKEFTLYDEILKKEKKSYKMQKKINSTHSDIDISLNAQIQRFDGNNSLSDSYENIPSNKDDEYYSIGAKVIIPFGKVKKENEKLKIKSSHLSYLIKKEQLLSELDSYHLEFISNAKLLQKSLKNQKISAKSSKIILNESRKKYKQARISLQTLIDDQNMDLETSLSSISISQRFLDLIFNYLTIFTLLDV